LFPEGDDRNTEWQMNESGVQQAPGVGEALPFGSGAAELQAGFTLGRNGDVEGGGGAVTHIGNAWANRFRSGPLVRDPRGVGLKCNITTGQLTVGVFH
jgi:hypothetical protein